MLVGGQSELPVEIAPIRFMASVPYRDEDSREQGYLIISVIWG